ncbi:MAG: allantoicase [Steroidobacterales bacterium]
MSADYPGQAELLKRYLNVADVRLGAVALYASDDFFAAKERMLQPSEPEWRAGVYDDHGKWMDGWESRRRRDPGHDHCVVRLAAPSTVAALDIDTRYFTGNYPPYASVQACRIEGDPDASTPWTELLPRSALQGDQHNLFELQPGAICTHIKLNIYPDGGVARFRVYGRVYRDWAHETGTELLDLAAALNGGMALACSDEHYGSMGNLLLPGRGVNMADGWETRRRRGPGYDWVILRLGHHGRIQRVDIDTAHYKGNYPHQVSIQGALLGADPDADLSSQCLAWPLLLELQHLQADSVHRYSAELRDLGPISHVRVNIHPDGGLSRVRMFGVPDRD